MTRTMPNWGPKSAAIKDEFSQALRGQDILRVFESKIKKARTKELDTQLAAPRAMLGQCCTALDAGLAELSALGSRAAIESAGYVILTRVPKGRRSFERDPPLDLAGKVRSVDFEEILLGLRTLGLDPKFAEAVGLVQFHGNTVAHEVSRADRTADGIQRELFKGGTPKRREDRYFFVPVHTPSRQAATEDARTAARLLARTYLAMARRAPKGKALKKDTGQARKR